MVKFWHIAGCLLWAHVGLAGAQVAAQDPDWQESDAPSPPPLRTNPLVAIDMPHFVSLSFGVDPASISLSPDGIVRYVMVAQNASGSVHAVYEGIRCATGQVKSYARASANGAWQQVKEPVWRGLNDNQPSKHALAFARQGACDGGTMAASSVADILKALKK